MRILCPCCGETYPIEAGFIDEDGKRLAALFAGMEPKLGRSILSYLRLFSPAKRGLRTAKAIKLIEELMTLVDSGQVQRDARTNDYRAASVNTWVCGIEQMLEARDRLQLPLDNHNYLRTVVFGIAGEPVTQPVPFKAPMVANDRASGKVNPMPARAQSPSQESYLEKMSKISGDLQLGLISQEEAQQRMAALHGRPTP